MALHLDQDGIEVVGLGMHFDELPIGRKFKTVGRTITEADLVAFVNATGFTEVLFTNTEFCVKRQISKAAWCQVHWSTQWLKVC